MLESYGLPTDRAPSTPGEILEEEFRKPLELTQEELARRLGTTVQTVNRIIRGRQAITAPMAIRLARVLETTPRLWLSLQADVDLWRAVTGR